MTTVCPKCRSVNPRICHSMSCSLRLVTLENLNGFVRDEIVPMYINLLCSMVSDEDVARVNKMIIDRWSKSALIYIKDKAWKIYDPTGEKFKTTSKPRER